MDNTNAHIAKPLPYVKSLEADAADARGCWPSDYCHRDDRENSPDCDCVGCALTMERRDHEWRVRAQYADSAARDRAFRNRRRTTTIDGKPIRTVIYNVPGKKRYKRRRRP